MAARGRGLRRAARGALAALEAALVDAAARAPRAAMRLAAALGAARQRLSGCWPSAAEVRALFDLDSAAASATARAIAALEARNRLVVALLARRGPEGVTGLLGAGVGAPGFPAPAVLLTFHVGLLHLLGEALAAREREILVVRHSPLYAVRPGQRIAFAGGGAGERAAALKEAVDHLRDGGSVLVAADGEEGETVERPCLGGVLRLGRGAFAMARLAKVPLLPVVARPARGRVTVEVGEPVAGPVEAAVWLEEFLRRAPGELGLGLLRHLLGTAD